MGKFISPNTRKEIVETLIREKIEALEKEYSKKMAIANSKTEQIEIEKEFHQRVEEIQKNYGDIENEYDPYSLY